MFSGCTVPPDSKKNELGSSIQEASPSAGKTSREGLVQRRLCKCIPTAIFGGVDISGVSLSRQMSYQ